MPSVFQALPVVRRRIHNSLIAIPLIVRDIARLELALIVNKRRAMSAAAATFAVQLSQAIRQNVELTGHRQA
jgi:hypothetical protein